MEQISSKFQNLVDDVRSAERTLEAVRKLSAQGGNFRIRLVVDHPDEEVREAVEALAARRMPRTNMMPSLLQAAEVECERAQSAMLNSALSIRMQQGIAADMAAE